MPPGTHARLGGSKAKRWINCPGSVQLESDFPDTSSPYAREGSAAHELAEWALLEEADPQDRIGDVIPIEYKEGGEVLVDNIVVTEDMADHVDKYVKYVKSIHTDGTQLFVEQRFNLEDLDPPDPMYGTADAVVWDPEERVLEIADMKFGRGVVVEAEGNDQLRMYSLGAVVSLRKKPAKIRATIVQPRAHHEDGVVRSDEFTFEELKAWKKEAWEAAEEAVNADEPTLQVGPWCKFCKASAVCPAQREHAMTVAQDAFVAAEEGDEELLPGPGTLPQDQLLEILAAKDMVEDWFRAIHDHVVEQLQRGVEVPGYKLVEGRSNRRWTDEDEAEKYLAGKGLKQHERLKMKVISPYQAEKALKRAGFDLDRQRKLDELITKPEGKPKLVQADHPKPALPPRGQEMFEADSNEADS